MRILQYNGKKRSQVYMVSLSEGEEVRYEFCELNSTVSSNFQIGVATVS